MAGRAMKLSPKRRGGFPPVEALERSQLEEVAGDAIALLAYQRWRERGCPIGSDLEDWFQAERDLQARISSRSS